MVEPLRQALELDPDLLPARLNLAYATLERNGRPEEALPHVERFLAAQPESVQGNKVLALVRRRQGGWRRRWRPSGEAGGRTPRTSYWQSWRRRSSPTSRGREMRSSFSPLRCRLGIRTAVCPGVCRRGALRRIGPRRRNWSAVWPMSGPRPGLRRPRRMPYRSRPLSAPRGRSGADVAASAGHIGMTSILGISAFYHDSAAALVVDGEIVAAARRSGSRE